MNSQFFLLVSLNYRYLFKQHSIPLPSSWTIPRANMDVNEQPFDDEILLDKNDRDFAYVGVSIQQNPSSRPFTFGFPVKWYYIKLVATFIFLSLLDVFFPSMGVYARLMFIFPRPLRGYAFVACATLLVNL